MKTIFKTLALGLLLMTVASCETHDPFDENTITGAVGPHAYWTIESSMVKAGESMGFVGQYYSTVDSNYIKFLGLLERCLKNQSANSSKTVNTNSNHN